MMYETFLILRRRRAKYVHMYIGRHVEYLLFLPYIKITCIFSTGFRKNNQISRFMKIRSVEAMFFHADYRTDTHDEANTAFHSSANAPKNCYNLLMPVVITFTSLKFH